MPIPDERLQQLISRKNGAEALAWCRGHSYGEGWAIIDGALVIYDHVNPPSWLAPVLEIRDDDGNTGMPPLSEQPDGYLAGAVRRLRPRAPAAT